MLSFPVLAPSMKVTISPDQVLQVMWFPADINHSSINYVLNISSATMAINSSNKITFPNTTVILTELPSTGTVSLQAKNPGALSEPVSVAYRMVNITGDG